MVKGSDDIANWNLIHLNLSDNPENFKRALIGKIHHDRYSQTAIVLISAVLKGEISPFASFNFAMGQEFRILFKLNPS